jgi:hypothetical protein
MSTTPLHPNSSNQYSTEQQESARKRNRAVVWGAILIVSGLLTLASSYNLFQGVAGFVFALLFAAGGLAFGYLLLTDHYRKWWAAIPMAALFALAGTIMVAEYAPGRMANLAGSGFLGMLGLGFLIVFAVRRDFWWALIPGGALFSLAVTAAIDESAIGSGSDLAGGVFLLGLGLTFLVVALERSQGEGRRWWAYIPAAVLIVLGLLVALSATALLQSFNVLVALAMVVGGGFLLYKARQ